MSKSTPSGVSKSTSSGVSKSTPSGVSKSTPSGVSKSTPSGVSKSTPSGVSKSIPSGVNQSTPEAIWSIARGSWCTPGESPSTSGGIQSSPWTSKSSVVKVESKSFAVPQLKMSITDKINCSPDKTNSVFDKIELITDRVMLTPNKHRLVPERLGPMIDRHWPTLDRHGPTPDRHGPTLDSHGPTLEKPLPGSQKLTPNRPRNMCDRPKTTPDRPRTTPDRPRTAPDRPRTAPDKPRTAPNRPRTAPDRPRTSPDGLRTTPDGPMHGARPKLNRNKKMIEITEDFETTSTILNDCQGNRNQNSKSVSVRPKRRIQLSPVRSKATNSKKVLMPSPMKMSEYYKPLNIHNSCVRDFDPNQVSIRNQANYLEEAPAKLFAPSRSQCLSAFSCDIDFSNKNLAPSSRNTFMSPRSTNSSHISQPLSPQSTETLFSNKETLEESISSSFGSMVTQYGARLASPVTSDTSEETIMPESSAVAKFNSSNDESCVLMHSPEMFMPVMLKYEVRFAKLVKVPSVREMCLQKLISKSTVVTDAINVASKIRYSIHPGCRNLSYENVIVSSKRDTFPSRNRNPSYENVIVSSKRDTFPSRNRNPSYENVIVSSKRDTLPARNKNPFYENVIVSSKRDTSPARNRNPSYENVIVSSKRDTPSARNRNPSYENVIVSSKRDTPPARNRNPSYENVIVSSKRDTPPSRNRNSYESIRFSGRSVMKSDRKAFERNINYDNPSDIKHTKPWRNEKLSNRQLLSSERKRKSLGYRSFSSGSCLEGKFSDGRKISLGGRDLPSGEIGLQSGERDLPSGQIGLQSGERDLPSGEIGLQSGKRDLPSGEIGLQSGKRDLPTCEIGLQSGERDFPSGERYSPAGGRDLPSHGRIWRFAKKSLPFSKVSIKDIGGANESLEDLNVFEQHSNLLPFRSPPRYGSTWGPK